MQVHGRDGSGMEFTSFQLQAIFLSRHRWQAVVDVKSHNTNHTHVLTCFYTNVTIKFLTIALYVGAEVTTKRKF